MVPFLYIFLLWKAEVEQSYANRAEILNKMHTRERQEDMIGRVVSFDYYFIYRINGARIFMSSHS